MQINVDAYLKPFRDWLQGQPRTPRYRYHVGDLSLEAAENPAVAALAALAREVSNGVYVEVSKCGHPRGKTVGTGRVALVTRRDRGETAHLAVRL